MDRALVLKKLETLAKRPSRIADVLREPRPMVVPSETANALGLQVVRALGERALWHARTNRVTEQTRAAYETLERDGVVAIPNFLPDDVFEAVKREYEESQRAQDAARIPLGDNIEARQTMVSDHLDRFPATAQAFRNSEFLLDLAAAISRRRRTFKPHVSFFTVTRLDPAEPHVDLDYNQFAHADRHYAFIKSFFYLNDVDEDTAPFSFAKGTHRMSSARARFEYEYSVKYCRIRNGDETCTEENLVANQELRDCAERLMTSTQQPCLPILGKANTLIVANNQGFHKRGELRGGTARATVQADFKYLESPAQWMFPVLKHLYRDP